MAALTGGEWLATSLFVGPTGFTPIRCDLIGRPAFLYRPESRPVLKQMSQDLTPGFRSLIIKVVLINGKKEQVLDRKLNRYFCGI